MRNRTRTKTKTVTRVNTQSFQPYVSKYGFSKRDLKTEIRFFYKVNGVQDLDLLADSDMLAYVGKTLEEFYEDYISECPVEISLEDFMKTYEEQCGWDTFTGRYVIMSNGVWFVNLPQDIAK